MQVVNLQIAPTGINPIIHMSQSDVGRQFQLRLYDGAVAYILPSGTTARIDGIKADGEGFSYTDAVAISGNTVTVTTKTQMTTTPGDVECEIRLVHGTEDIGTLNFIMAVEESPLSNVDISKTDLPEIIEEVRAAAESATTSAEIASTSATTASNAATSASTSASNADTNALKSEGYATGKQNGTDVPSGSDYYHNNARYYAEIARSLSANPPYIGANGNWYVWSMNAGAYVDSGIDASITVTIADITMLATNENPYVTNTGTDTDPIFHLFIPRGAGIQNITKTSTSGLVDTYTITFTDGQTTTYTVTNGAKGDTGDSAGFGTPTASIDGNVGTPSVTVTATGPDTAKVFNFAFSNLKGETGERGPQGVTGDTGVGIVSITKTATQGLVDTYTVLLTNDQTYTFTVTNGQNGTGAGDMLSTDYDPTQAVYNAGGIVAYVASQISGLSTSLSGLTDVALTSLVAGQSLVYDATTQKWVNGSVSYNNLANKPSLKPIATSGNASDVDYTNTTSGLTATKVQAAIDEVAAENQTLTKNVDVLIENGAVNHLPTNAVTQTINGVTFTVNTDPSSEEYGAVTITTESGGSTALTQLILFEGVANWHNMVLSGAPSTASATTYDLSAYDTQTSGENSCRPNDVVLTNITDGHTIRVFIRVRSGQVITEPITFKPMIADANYTGGYIPYAKTNRELTKDDSGLTANAFENGCVNILPNKATSNTYTGGGANLTVVVDKDKNTITANGMTGSTPIYVEVYYNASGLPFLKNGKKYILSGAPSGVPYTDAYLFINKSPEIASSNGNSKEFTFDSSVGRTTVSIIFAANKTFTNAVFKPMITVADMPNSDYTHSVPHAMTNRELTEKVEYEYVDLSDSNKGVCTVTRIGDLKILKLADFKNMAAGNNAAFFTIPENFRPLRTAMQDLILGNGAIRYRVTVNTTGSVTIYNYGSAIETTAINGIGCIVYI